MSALAGFAVVVTAVIAAAQSAAGAPWQAQVGSWTGLVAIVGIAVEWGSRKAKQDATDRDVREMGERVNRIEDRIEARLTRIEHKIDNLGG